MHKSTILGLSLVSMLFLATTTSIPMQVSAIPVSAFHAQEGSAGSSELTDEQIICEECIKYWLNFLNAPETVTLLNALIKTINVVNFDNSKCSNKSPIVSGATCLKTGSSSAPYDTAQLSKICENLELALKYAVFDLGFSPEKVLAHLEDAVKSQTKTEIDKVVKGLFDCFEKALLPAIFRCDVTVDDPPIPGFNGPAGVAYDEEHNRMYVTNQGSNTVSVIDTTTNTVIDTDGNGATE